MTINVSAEEIERQALIFASENQRPPTDDDIRALLFAHIEEEALMREALKRGLDKDDTIIRRRLAQKMRFIIEDIDEQTLPKRAVLEKAYTENIERFSLAETRSFAHIYVNPDTKGENLDAEIARIDAQLKGQAGPKSDQEPWHALGDPFMLQRLYKNLSQSDVRRLFGAEFAGRLFEITADSWQGPIDSAFGRHLVYVQRIKPGKIPAFEDVKDEVEQFWRDENQRLTNQSELRSLIKRYKVNVEDLGE